MVIGLRVAAKRNERDLTQQQLAEKVGVSRQTLSLIERGLQCPAWDTAYLLADVLRCEIFDLLPTCRQARKFAGSA